MKKSVTYEKVFDKERILSSADIALSSEPLHITDVTAKLSPGSKHEFYSNGDYWWPNPDTESGLPYVRRDGESNPDNFNAHRMILRKMRSNVASLSAAYSITSEEKYADAAVRMLREFFLDVETRMLPHLKYAQAIPGVRRQRNRYYRHASPDRGALRDQGS